MEQGNIFQLNSQPIKASLGSETIDPNSVYMVDFTKLSSVNDLVLILAAMSIAFPGNHPHIEALRPFLNLQNPIPQQRMPQPEAKEMKLPKLKKVK
jgi:hypothetical protein